MMLMTETPSFPSELGLGLSCTGPGELLAQLGDEPAGPWLAVLLDGIDPSGLTDLELPEYLRQCARVRAWASAKLTAGVVEISSRPTVTCPDKEVALALCEPAGTAQRRIWIAARLVRRLPRLFARHREGELSAEHVEKVVEATGRVHDRQLLATVEERVAHPRRAQDCDRARPLHPGHPAGAGSGRCAAPRAASPRRRRRHRASR